MVDFDQFFCQIHFEWLHISGHRCLGHEQEDLVVSQKDLESRKLSGVKIQENLKDFVPRFSLSSGKSGL